MVEDDTAGVDHDARVPEIGVVVARGRGDLAVGGGHHNPSRQAPRIIIIAREEEKKKERCERKSASR